MPDIECPMIENILVERGERFGSAHSAVKTTLCPQLYCCDNVIRLPVGEKLDLVYSVSGRSAKLLSRELIDLLAHCQSFKTIDEHAQSYQTDFKSRKDPLRLAISELSNQLLPARLSIFINHFRNYMHKHDNNSQTDHAHIKFIRDQLSELIATGLLVSDTGLLEACIKSVSAEDPSGINSLAVLTRNRIPSLERCLVSYIQNTKQHGRAIDFVVADDSEGPVARDDTRSLLSSLSARYDVKVCYAGLEEKKRFAKTLVATGDVPPDVVDFALFDVEGCGFTAGANHNAVTLHTIGDMVFSTDDDIICQPTCPQKMEQRLGLFSGIDPIKMWFFPDRESALHSSQLVDCDALSMHEQLLGKTLSSCVSSFDGATDLFFNRKNSKLMQGLQSGGSVQITFGGILGDSGAGSPFGYLLLGDDSRERLLTSEQSYRSALLSREIWRGVIRPCITDAKWCMTGTYGCDNRTLIPPFMPVMRGQDTVFGITAQMCFDDRFFGHVPLALTHAPFEVRSYPPVSVWEDTSNYTICDVMLSVLSMKSWVGRSSSRAKLQELGKHFMELGSMTLLDYEECVRVQLWHLASNTLSLLENTLIDFGQSPDYWAKDVKECMSVLRGKLLKNNQVIPIDIMRGRTADEARILTQKLTFKFGQLLYWWPEIVEIAGRLRAKNQRLAAAV